MCARRRDWRDCAIYATIAFSVQFQKFEFNWQICMCCRTSQSAKSLLTCQIKSNHQIKSLLLSHHHSTSALVSEILMSVLQTVQKNNRQFTYGQTVQKNNRQFTYGQTVQKTALEHLQCSRQCKKTTTAIYIWTDSAKKATAIYIWTVHITDCTEDNVQNTHTYTQYT